MSLRPSSAGVRALLTGTLTLLLLAGIAWHAGAFTRIGLTDRWPANTAIVLSLQLGTRNQGTLQDGSPSYDAVAAQAAQLWNAVLGSNTRFVTVVAGQGAGGLDDSLNSVFFATNFFGQGFGDAVAITTSNGSEEALEEADVVFNARLAFDSYRGSLQVGSPTVYDFRRVALHEFGHVLGLDHPDQAGQSVAAIMNSRVSNVDQLLLDDINGAQSIYGTPEPTPPAPNYNVFPPPSFSQALSGVVAHFYSSAGEPIVGGQESLLDSARGYTGHYSRSLESLADGVRTIHEFNFYAPATPDIWVLSVVGPARPASEGAQPLSEGTFEFTAASRTDPTQHAIFLVRQRGSVVSAPTLVSGRLQVRNVTYAGDQLTSAALDFSILSGVDPAPRALLGQVRFNTPSIPLPAPRIVNLSTRADVGLGAAQAIAGFVLRDPAGRGKAGLLRVTGTSLRTYGITDFLDDATITLNDAGGAPLDFNDDWANPGFYPSPQAPIFALNLVPPGRTESLLFRRFGAGAFTAVVGGFDNGAGPATGVALVELYDLEIGTDATLLNVSTRGRVGAAGRELIGGFALAGPGSKKIIVRALGPSLAAFGVSGALADPQVTVFDAAGNAVATNDNWQGDPASAQVVAKGLAPTNALEAALFLTLAPGTYTAVVRGAGGGTGTALVEVYDAD
ncbi:MAG: matrixin family metalloprotease [Verrucomicrobia bacterium]|nr:matrixin family metalloprotease [Verrucomicrobiota bacterium]